MTITSIRPAMVLYRCPFCKRYYSMPNFYDQTEIYPPDEVITARILRDQCRALRDSILHDQVFRDRCRDLRDQVLRTPAPAGQSGISQTLNEGDGVYRP